MAGRNVPCHLLLFLHLIVGDSYDCEKHSKYRRARRHAHQLPQRLRTRVPPAAFMYRANLKRRAVHAKISVSHLVTCLSVQVTDLVWMSHADCVRVARAVFLDTATLYYRDLIDTVESQASGWAEAEEHAPCPS